MSETVVVVAPVGAASGSRTAAAALACAASRPDRAGLLVDLAEPRRPRPSLASTAAARALEERLAIHLPDARVASRGQTCHLVCSPNEGWIEAVVGALPLVRESVAVVHLPPSLLQPVLEETRVRVSAALLRADLPDQRALTALAVRDLASRDVRVVVLKQPLGWIASRRALAGALPAGAGGALPARAVRRLLGTREEAGRWS